MQPFSGIRILDLTHVFAGPFATFQLAVLGADVIKIEPPDNPDMSRDEGVSDALNENLTGTGFMAQGAGKRSLVLDLRDPEGRDVFLDLVRTADVMVQNYAGDALDRLALGYDDVAAVNPRIIHCSMTGYGRTGPKAAHPAYDAVIQAWSGMMMVNGWKTGDPPLRVGTPVIDYGTGIHAAYAISAALFQRERTGKGQKIDLGMADAALMMMTAYVTDTLATGRAAGPNGNEYPSRPSNAAYQTADGWLMVACNTPRQFAGLMRALGHTERADELLGMRKAEMWLQAESDRAKIAASLRERSAAEWEDLLNAADVPAARVRRTDETLREAQTRSRGLIGSYGAPLAPDGPPELPVAAFRYAHDGPAISAPPPGFGAHSREILLSLGLSEERIGALVDRGTVICSA